MTQVMCFSPATKSVPLAHNFHFKLDIFLVANMPQDILFYLFWNFEADISLPNVCRDESRWGRVGAAQFGSTPATKPFS